MSPEELRFHGIYQKYFSKILTYVKAKLSVAGLPGNIAEDLVQGAFTILWLKWDENQFKTDEILLKWLYNTANNKLMESYRSEDAQQHDTIEAHERDLMSPGGITEIEEQVASEVRMRELEAFLGEQSCRIIQLIADGYKYKECAEILQVPIGTICGMVHRIREEMKKPENAEKIKKILG